MAYEMDMKKGLYPDEPGYIEFKAANFPNEMAIEQLICHCISLKLQS